MRKIKILPELSPLVKAIGHSSQTLSWSHLSHLILTTVHLKDVIFGECCSVIQKELQLLCTKSQPSVLRKKSKSDLKSFSWDVVYGELLERTPHFLKMLEASCVNLNTAKENKSKTSTNVRNAMCSAGCKILSIFNEDMSAVRYLNTLTMVKGGLKKHCFVRLCATYDTMSYMTSHRILENVAKDHDKILKEWQGTVLTEITKERQLIQELKAVNDNLQEIENTQPLYAASLFQKVQLEDEIKSLRASMHPGEYLVKSKYSKTCQGRPPKGSHKVVSHAEWSFIWVYKL